MGGVDFAEASTKVFDHSTSENNITESGLDIQEVCIATNGTQTVVPASPSATETNTSTLTPLSSVSPRQGSPVLSSNGSSKEASKLVDLATIARNGSPPAKRRKLTVAEKDQRMQEKQEKQKEKQAKEVERAEKKARLDEEKRTKDEKREEARRRKEVEREQKMQAKEKEKRKKDEDRQRKEEVKDKKDKAQLRLNAFFKPPMPAKSSATAPTELAASPNGRRACDSKPLEEERLTTPIPTTSHQVTSSDYRVCFGLFFAKDNVHVASQHMFGKDAQGMELVREAIDRSIQHGRIADQGESKSPTKLDMFKLCSISPHRRERWGRQDLTTKEIIIRLNEPGQEIIDLTGAQQLPMSQRPADLLNDLSMKFLRFKEDIRPPYMGTFTKKPPGRSARGLCRNPFKRSIPQLNYDYDSEAEWEEPDPDDGEDLGSEDEEAGSEGDENEMEGFLDDEEAAINPAASNKRRLVVGDLEPICTGLCWEDRRDNTPRNASEDSLAKLDLSVYKMEIIEDAIDIPIDPYTASYWQCTSGLPAVHTALPKRENSSMNSPRIPLHVINRTHAGVNANISPTPISLLSDGKIPETASIIANPSQIAKPNKRLIPVEHMAEFKRAIQGSELTKIGLVEVLKKKFPKISKDVIKESLGLVAHRVGAKESEKVWALLDGT